MSDKIELYFYNGMAEPEKIDTNDLTISSNYLGDVTGAFISEYRETLENYTPSDMVENQPLYEYNVFINLSKLSKGCRK